MTDPISPSTEREISGGDRFGFGANWAKFLTVVDEPRIAASVHSLTQFLPAASIRGRTFLDVGCGSGLSSLAALRVGAERIYSFDFDLQSVACTEEIKRRYASDAANWTVTSGDVLDDASLSQLGEWDIVYSWGVLHHTGQMWHALANAGKLVKPGGTLFVAIYNDQGRASRVWAHVKRLYNRSRVGRAAVLSVYIPYFVLTGLVLDLIRRQSPTRRYRSYWQQRGMSIYHDWIDWLGGLPFEVATPEQVFDFFHDRGFTLERMQTCAGGLGCNQFVFTASQSPR
ncbi:MAG: class I SAM-dependent methyltransferase [Gemmatimonadaceae bacterium]